MNFPQLVRSVCERNESLTLSRLFKFGETERLDLCIAAKKDYPFDPKVDSDGYTLPVLLSREVEVAQMIEIIFSDRTEKRVVIKCPSSPPMYIYFNNLKENNNLKVFFVDGQQLATLTPSST